MSIKEIGSSPMSFFEKWVSNPMIEGAKMYGTPCAEYCQQLAEARKANETYKQCIRHCDLVQASLSID